MSSVENLKSVQTAQRSLQRFLRKINTVPKEQLKVCARQMYTEIVSQTPYRTGKLEDSVKVDLSFSGDEVRLVASAKAKDEHGKDYAVVQHENTRFKHPIKGKAYYISDPFKHQVALMRRRVRYRLKKMGGG